jgi:glycosyltransferase involved in cell wall biosynthesis
VSRFIRNIAQHARDTGKDLRVLTSTNFEIEHAPNLLNVPPLCAMAMPKYEHLELALPPVRRMLRLAAQLRPDVIHVSTPGSVGLVGRLAARKAGCPLVGVYHTDFPAYIDTLFGDHALTAGCTSFMRWFYKPFTSILTRSDASASALLALGIARERLHTLKAGIMLGQFHPRYRDLSIWPALLGDHGAQAASGTVRVLYCGRLSAEKGLPQLARCWIVARAELARLGTRAQLVLVGDGPARNALQRQLRDHDAHFLGFRHGSQLSVLYASSDFFVFPSTTDTLGQVVMESQASGLPALVTDVGGPKEIVRDRETGFVLPALPTIDTTAATMHLEGSQAAPLDALSPSQASWVRAIVHLATHAHDRLRMGHSAHQHMQQASIATSFEHYWSVHENALQRQASPE